MEAREALERFDKLAEGSGAAGHIARNAAIVVAVLAGILAVSTFLSNEAIKEVITGETKAADTTAVLEANNVKTTIADASSVLLRVVAVGNPKEAQAAGKAEELEARIDKELKPVDRRLTATIKRDERMRDRADNRHLIYELSQVGLQIGIVLAGISILAQRNWLLRFGGLLGTAGAALLAVGLAY